MNYSNPYLIYLFNYFILFNNKDLINNSLGCDVIRRFKNPPTPRYKTRRGKSKNRGEDSFGRLVTAICRGTLKPGRLDSVIQFRTEYSILKPLCQVENKKNELLTLIRKNVILSTYRRNHE